MDPFSVIAFSVALTAGTSLLGGVQNYFASQQSKNAADALKDQQRAELAKESADRTAQAAHAATAGAAFGFGATTAFDTGLGSNKSSRALLTGGPTPA